MTRALSTMTKLPWDAFFAPVEKRISDMFNDFNTELYPYLQGTGNYPRCNIVETDESFIIEAAVPGMRKEDVSIEITNDVICISGEKQERLTGDLLRKELHFSRFQRSFTLPNYVDTASVTAAYDSGILSIEFKKKTEFITETKKIEIQ